MNSILFIATSYHFNGGSTYLLRIVKELQKQSIQPRILFLHSSGNDQILEQLANNAEVYFLNEHINYPLLTGFFYLINLFRTISDSLKLIINDTDHIHVMGVFAYLFVRIQNIYKKVSAGVYHQNEYFSNNSNNSFLSKWIDNQLRNTFPASNWVIFSKSVKEIYESKLNSNLKDSLIIPIGINYKEYQIKENRNVNRLKITSVGNLWAFKTYNKHVINAMPKLIQINGQVEYHIFGDGDNKAELMSLVKNLSVEKHVIFHGRISYSKMLNEIKDSLVFVGSGTTIIEASALGIPSIIGIENEKHGKTYGFLFEVPGYSYNEDNLAFKKRSIEKTLDEVLNCSSEKYHELCVQSKLKAKTFDIEKTILSWNKWHDQMVHKIPVIPVSLSEKVCLLCSMLNLGLKHIFNIGESFRARKNNI